MRRANLLQCLFWNTNGQDRRELLAEAVCSLGVDVIAVAEPGCESSLLAAEISSRNSAPFEVVESVTERLQVIAGPKARGLRERYAEPGGKLVIHSLGHGASEVLFAFAHLVSPVRWDSRDQAAQTQVLADDIRRFEENVGHRRTVLMGDLNLDPFDNAVVQAAGLHATMTKSSALRETRTVQSRPYPYFYNPMWGFFGDRTPGPPGTCSFPQNGHPLSYEWSIFDQVLIRPDMLEKFIDVEILANIGPNSLCNGDGKPNSEVGSDHFPLILKLHDLS